VRRGTEEELRENCRTPSGESMFRDSQPALGCTMQRTPIRDDCTIYIVEDRILQRWSTSYDIVYRHERGHCNNAHHDEQGRWLK
jgi:hypothetical protein